jgi:hypothetical protein
VAVLREILGHKDINTTMIYITLDDSYRIDEASTMNGFLPYHVKLLEGPGNDGQKTESLCISFLSHFSEPQNSKMWSHRAESNRRHPHYEINFNHLLGKP